MDHCTKCLDITRLAGQPTWNTPEYSGTLRMLRDTPIVPTTPPAACPPHLLAAFANQNTVVMPVGWKYHVSQETLPRTLHLQEHDAGEYMNLWLFLLQEGHERAMI